MKKIKKLFKKLLNSFLKISGILTILIIILGGYHGLQMFIHKEVKNVLNDPAILVKIRPYMIIDNKGSILLDSGCFDIIDIKTEEKPLRIIIIPKRQLNIAPIITPIDPMLPFNGNGMIKANHGKGRNWEYNINNYGKEYCRFRVEVIL